MAEIIKKDSYKLRCSRCSSKNIYTLQKNVVVCRKCGNREERVANNVKA